MIINFEIKLLYKPIKIIKTIIKYLLLLINL